MKEYFGGYLPVVVDVTDALKWGEDNVIAVWADNSDDPSYPPGKAQDVLDYGSQVYDNYCSGKVNFVSVDLSAVSPTGKLLKLLLQKLRRKSYRILLMKDWE